MSTMTKITSNEHWIVDYTYKALGMKNVVSDCYVQEKVNEQLIIAAKHLPSGYKFKIYDCWRPLSLQKELYNLYKKEIILANPGLFGNELDEYIKKFVSYPCIDPPPVHTTGSAIDLTIINADGKELNMGTNFDDLTEKAFTNYFINKEVQRNRNLLLEIMSYGEFVNLPSEWWHFSYGSQHWGEVLNKKPLFNAGYFSENDIKG